MAIRLDHIIVPSHDRVEAAKLLAGLLDVSWEESRGDFAPVYVNENLTLDFAQREQFESHHICFHVADADFEAILRRIQPAGIPDRGVPHGGATFWVKHPSGGRKSSWKDAPGPSWDISAISHHPA